jgi:hypothetical protein
VNRFNGSSELGAREGWKPVNGGAHRISIAFGNAGTRVSENSGGAKVRESKQPRVQTISRQELYDLVWSESITALTKRFGLSDRGLTKVCRRSDVPAPPRRYWAKIAARRPMERPDLPSRDDLDFRKIRFRINRNASQLVSSQPS